MKYEIKGGNLPVAVCTLQAGETVITEGGGMSWMSPNMKMETTSGGGVGKMLGRMLSGESLFLNRYTAEGGEGTIAFASSFPGDIKAYQLSPGKGMIVQKSGFLASESSVQLSAYVQNGLGKGLVGGEGFIMQKLSGTGTVFIEIDGSAIEYDLAAGEKIVLSTGTLAAMDESCTMEVQMVKGVKNMFLGGEGMFNTTVTGPGKVVLQTMPLVNVAQILKPYIVKSK